MDFAAQAVQLYRVLTPDGQAAPDETPYSDCDDENVRLAAALGIVTGYEDGTFRPFATITREEAAAMLNRLYKILGGTQTEESRERYADDAQFGAWSRDSIYAMREIGIMKGEENNAFHPAGGYTGEQALEKYRENQDLAVAILDVMLPGIDGYEVCRTMRAEGYQAGVIMLTARTQEADKVNGLMNGADDYVTKPFSSIELVARVDALYRRVSGSPFSEEDVIKSGPFKLNLRAREVLKNGRKIELTQIEYGLLKAFMQNIGKALSRDELLEMVWGHHYVGELKIVDVNIRRLRIKIEDDPAEPSHIVTVRGYGYMWEG